MIYIKQFIVNPVQENCYVVSDDTLEAVIIDCGCFEQKEWDKIKSYIKAENLKIVHLLNTHLHFDHTLGNRFVYNDFCIMAKAHHGDSSLYSHTHQQLSLFFGNAFSGISIPIIDTSLKTNEILVFGEHKIKVLHTPGHSQGGVCFYCEEEDALWSGDTLFEGSVGRTDLEGGNYSTLIKSINENLLSLPGETRVFPGHGPMTTIGDEKKFNPYI